MIQPTNQQDLSDLDPQEKSPTILDRFDHLTVDQILTLPQSALNELSALSKTDPLFNIKLINKLSSRSLTDLLKTKKKTTNQPYFKEKFAVEIKRALDWMITEKKSIEFPLKKFPKYTIGTLRNRLNQSIQYLQDMLDPVGVYKSFRSNYEIRAHNTGVTLAYLSNDVPVLYFEEAKPYASFAEIKEMVNTFIATAPDQVIVELPQDDMKEFFLRDEEIEELNAEIFKYKYIKAIVQATSIKLKKDMSKDNI